MTSSMAIRVRSFCIEFLMSDRSAVTALEYGILASILGIAILIAFGGTPLPGLSGYMSAAFSRVGSSI